MFIHCPPKNLQDLESQTLNGKRFYTTPDGKRLPSVTTVLGAKPKPHLLEWRKRVGEEEANRITKKSSGRGTNLHQMCEDYVNNKPLSVRMPDALEMFKSLKPLLHRINNVHYQEQALWSYQLNMAGRVDCIAEFDGELSIIDYKNSRRIKTREQILDYFHQTTAYALMYEELIGKPINKLVILMAVEDDEPQLFIENTEDHIHGLVEAIHYYQSTVRD